SPVPQAAPQAATFAGAGRFFRGARRYRGVRRRGPAASGRKPGLAQRAAYRRACYSPMQAKPLERLCRPLLLTSMAAQRMVWLASVMMKADPNTNPVVAVGKSQFGNALPLALIAGPCALESRAHALEMASALKEIAARRKIGLVYKTSFDKANRTSSA